MPRRCRYRMAVIAAAWARTGDLRFIACTKADVYAIDERRELCKDARATNGERSNPFDAPGEITARCDDATKRTKPRESVL